MSLIQVIPFSKHKEIKDDLLKIISNTRSDTVDSEPDFIHNSDWETDIGESRAYWEFIGEDLLDCICDTMLDTYGLRHFQVQNFWFQQYETGGTHSWHRHRFTLYNAVYYVEFPKDGPVTEIELPVSKEIISPNIQEGDIVIFPSICLHRSAPNKSKDRKTIIAFNLD